MSKRHPNPSRLLSLIAATLLSGLILTAPAHAQSSQLRRLVGAWEASTQSAPDDKRSVRFVVNDGKLTGTYTTDSGQKLPITRITFSGGKYSFRVPDAQLVFRDLRLVGRALEGVKISTALIKGRNVPQVVRIAKISP